MRTETSILYENCHRLIKEADEQIRVSLLLIENSVRLLKEVRLQREKHGKGRRGGEAWTARAPRSKGVSESE
jgi:hypothetical protein